VKIYLVAGLAFVLIIFNIIRVTPDAVEDTSNYPSMTYEQIVAEHKTLADRVEKPFSSYKEYFDVIDRLLALELACKKHERNHEELDPRYPGTIRNVLGSISFLRTENESRGRIFTFAKADRIASMKEFQEASKNRDLTYSNMILFPKKNPEAEGKFLQALVVFQFGFMPFALLVYAVRIRYQKGSISFEMMSNPLFPIYLLLWEIGIFIYQATGLQLQIRRMIRYASLTLSAILSFGAATVKAQTKSENKDSGSGNGHTLVVSGNVQYLSSYLGLDGAVFHPAPVLQSSLTIAHKNGIYLNLWKSVATTHVALNPNFGFEEDYALGYSRKFGKRMVDVSLTYFNVTPLGKLAKGDLLQSSVRVSGPIPKLPISHYLWIRNVHPLRNGNPPEGWFVHFGVDKSIKVPKKTHLDLVGEAVFDSGAFGFKRAGIFRSSANFKVPWKKLVYDLPIYRMSTPFTGPGDSRKFEQVLGVGLSLSFAQ
jgi:hypothetical protein